MLDQNASTPLYEQLKNAIRKEIDEKKYSSGDRMPSEAELEKLYNVSRITVRRAIKELCDEEVLVRRQGKGTLSLARRTGPGWIVGLKDFMSLFERMEEVCHQKLWISRS